MRALKYAPGAAGGVSVVVAVGLLSGFAWALLSLGVLLLAVDRRIP